MLTDGSAWTHEQVIHGWLHVKQDLDSLAFLTCRGLTRRGQRRCSETYRSKVLTSECSSGLSYAS